MPEPEKAAAFGGGPGGAPGGAELADSTDARSRCELVLARAFRGIHHVPQWETRERAGDGYWIKLPYALASYDGDALTRLVVAAHDECVRIEILPHSRAAVKVLLHPRERDGQVWARHPTMEAATAAARTSS